MNNWRCFGFGLLVAATVGCGETADRPERYPVSGTVIYGKKPLAGASVSFWAEGAARPATGVTDEDGKFQLSMFEPNDGAIAGEHTITVNKREPAKASTADIEETLNDPTAMTTMMQDSAQDGGQEFLIPEVYSSQATTPLKQTVSPDDENIFELKL